MAHVVRELDLSHHYGGHGSIVDKMNAVPGLKTSTDSSAEAPRLILCPTAFFTFLRANLNVNPSAMSSNANTPMLEPYPTHALPPPSPSPLVTVDPPSQPVPDDLPALSCGVVNAEIDKVDALNLVTDSIAQQRQTSSLHLVFHPYLVSVLVVSLALAFQYSWRMKRDLGLALMLHSGVVMTYLLGIRFVTGRYIVVAEAMKWDWMVGEDGEEDTVIGVRFGKELIGTLFLRLEPSPNLTGKKRTRASALKGGKGVIRAWTVKLKYRHKGVGTDMLQEAVKVTREKCGKDAAVGFAQEHANSAVVMPEAFNGQMRRGEQKAAKALEDVLAEWEEVRRHKRGNSR
ncbi:hypothetical protein JX265_000201 [Neoarthrinium moseri]|uniref:N-acetyltransferase domain-containing protein n=1 Tax=Neoarthrinium moseri TaxID=1658444 RepID=A0A9P9WY09_9PEZI|nr:hypothetical protein JX265_000201 [Neoarthrinium moseri]